MCVVGGRYGSAGGRYLPAMVARNGPPMLLNSRSPLGSASIDPFTLFTAVEGPIGQDVENLLEVTGIQQDVLDPIFRLLGPLGGLLTS
jgi:hypothetical protein